MTSAEGHAVSGPETGRVRAAALLDSVAGLLLAVLLYPFPVMRAAFSVPVFVVSILVSVALIQVLLAATSLVIAGRTIGMHMFGLEFDEGPRPVRALLWAVVWTIALVPGLLSGRPFDPARGWAAGATGLTFKLTVPS